MHFFNFKANVSNYDIKRLIHAFIIFLFAAAAFIWAVYLVEIEKLVWSLKSDFSAGEEV